MESSVRRQYTETALGPVMSHTPYSHLDCGAPLYTLVYADAGVVDTFMTYS